MDHRDREAIENLFARLEDVERQAPPRDLAAEAFIGEQLARQPHAPYFMAQTIIVQEQALNAAQARIEELEREIAPDQRSGVVSGLFGKGAGSSRSTGSVPSVGRPERSPFRQLPGSRGGAGFLAGAAQTAMGVAGGILLGNMIAGLFGDNQAQAAQSQADGAPSDNAEAQDAGLSDSGIGDGGFGDFDI